jgi:parallel beta-helix repeat protein
MNKLLTVGATTLFICLAFTQSITASEPTSNQTISSDDNGTLSGYVKDTSMNPIEGARVEVYFHETYKESYTDSSGYYHVTNIPICYCLKNATVSKKGYRSECVLLSINETTTHNFVLTFLGKTLYVGGSGPGNYSRIQDAVDNASNWDTVFVYSGIYSDYFPDNWACVKITKNINLVGEDKHTTIINGSGFNRAVIIYAEDVDVSGFTIQHGKNPKPMDWILGIDISHYKSNDIRIFDNIIANTSRGIYTHQTSANIQIYDNLIMNNYYGIENAFDNAPLNVFNNTIINNEYGVHSHASEMVLSNNLISNNNVGIYMQGIDSNYTIITNEISRNEIGIKLDGTRSTIEHNNFINNEKEVKASMNLYFVTILKFNNYKQRWISNYWDDWNTGIPRAILGFGIYYIIIFKIHPKLSTPFPIALFPYFEYDWNPATEPYDIPIPKVP